MRVDILLTLSGVSDDTIRSKCSASTTACLKGNLALFALFEHDVISNNLVTVGALSKGPHIFHNISQNLRVRSMRAATGGKRSRVGRVMLEESLQQSTIAS